MTFDPNFATNHYVYVYYTVPRQPRRTTASAASRPTATWPLPASELVIMDLDNLSGATNHNGGAIHFGPDGKLYVAVGDNAIGSTRSR